MKVIAYVHVTSKDGTHTVVLKPGDTVPEWAEVTNPDAVEQDEADEEQAPKPRRSSAK